MSKKLKNSIAMLKLPPQVLSTRYLKKIFELTPLKLALFKVKS